MADFKICISVPYSCFICISVSYFCEILGCNTKLNFFCSLICLCTKKSFDENLMFFIISVEKRISKRKPWLTSRVHTKVFFEFLKKIKLTRLASWVKRPISPRAFINRFLQEKKTWISLQKFVIIYLPA